MPTVRDVTWDLLRSAGLTTVFGNPGSNELPFLAGMPADFHYVLGLHEGVVVGMADGYAMASGRPAFVNLHAAAGTGNAMGALTNAQHSHSPIVITAGQQVRAHIGVEALLSIPAPTVLPQPLVKWSAEPAVATDVPRSLAQAVRTATTAPAGPVFVSVPYDDWARSADDGAPALLARQVAVGSSPSAGQVEALVAALRDADSPALVLGPDVDSARAHDLAVALADRLAAPVWLAPSTSRCPFPTTHAAFRGMLPASIAGIGRALDGHDVVLVVGAPVFRYHQYEPGRALPDGTRLLHVTVDPAEAARAPMGDALVAGIRETLAAVLAVLPQTGRGAPSDRRRPDPLPAADGPLPPETVLDVIDRVAPDDTIYLCESTSTTSIFWDHVDVTPPGGFYFPAAGGLGFGLAAAVGVQLAEPDRQVVAIIGDGSANYAISALWTAAQEAVPVVVVILRNGTYAALRSFAAVLDAKDTPGMDVPDIDFCALAAGYGVDSARVGDAAELEAVLRRAVGRDRPFLIEVPTTVVDPLAGHATD